MTRESTSPEMAAQLISAMGKFDVRDRLSELALPVLVIHTRGDARVTLERGKELAKGIPQAEFISLDGNNHIIMEGDAAFVQFKAAIDDFLRRHPI
jgi:pimeloyl-ACP methyl ester carboxylesterase